MNSADSGRPGPGSLPTRRDMLTLGIGAFLVASVPLNRLRRGRALVRRRIPAMGTVAEVSILHEDERYAQRAIDAALCEIRWTEDILTRFRPASDVGRVNRAAPGRAVEVDPETACVLDDAIGLAAASRGRFDPALGRATELWEVGTRSTPPADDEVRTFAGRELYRSIEVETVAGRAIVRVHRPEVAIDLGGIGKGWGVDRAVQALRDWGIQDGLVNIGGDLYALGNSAHGDPWTVGVRDPSDPDSVIARLPLSNGAVATSGDYERYFAHLGRRYHHILDPATGEPVRTEARSLTVSHDRCAVADACATALFSVPADESTAVLHNTSSSARLVHSVIDRDDITSSNRDSRTALEA